jgi:hypothetical protein
VGTMPIAVRVAVQKRFGVMCTLPRAVCRGELAVRDANTGIDHVDVDAC